MPSFVQRIRHGWNAFLGRDPTKVRGEGPASYLRPDRYRVIGVNAQTLVNFIYNRIAVEVSQIDFKHIRVDLQNRYIGDVNSDLFTCLTLSANVDQTGRDLIRDITMSIFNEGVIAVVPVDTTDNPDTTGSFDITSLRTGKIIEWYPDSVKVHLYNERDGKYHDIVVPKATTAIIENPFYYIMNEPNSTLQQLVRTIARLNAINDQAGSDKLDLIIQLPYALKGDLRIDQAKKRKAELEDQLVNSKYGVAYIDSTEHVTQLNRSLQNNLWDQVQALTQQLYNQLGLTQGIFDGTANSEAILQYQNTTLIPICNAISEEMTRKWISKTAYTQGQRIGFFRDLFKLIPLDKIGDLADKLTQDAVVSPNEIRTRALGLPPADDPSADELRNPKINKSDAEIREETGELPGMDQPMEEVPPDDSQYGYYDQLPEDGG